MENLRIGFRGSMALDKEILLSLFYFRLWMLQRGMEKGQVRGLLVGDG